MAKADISAAFDMEPADAVAYLRAKGYTISDRWQEVWQGAHARAFTVAKAMRMDVLEAIRGEVDKTLSQGGTFAEFEKALQPQLEKLGWWGKQVMVDSDGGARLVQLGSPNRLKTIYRTNLQTAYMAGRYRRQLATTNTHPWWQYVAVLDSRTRESHAALNGKVFRFDDPIWQYLYPPNGWGCRCRVRALTERQLQRMGLQVEQGDGYIETFQAESGINPRTGEVEMVDHMRVRLPNGKTMTPDIGWAYNPGSAAFGTDVAIAKKLGTVRDINLRGQLVQALNNSPLRHQQFANWAADVLAKRRAGHGVQALGFLPEAVSTAITERFGVVPSRLMTMNEKSLMHADSAKHSATGVALSQEELLALPQMVNEPEAVLWDKTDPAVLMIYPASDGRAVKIVVKLAHQVKRQQQPLDAVINTYRAKYSDLRNEGLYERISGELRE
ncbi:MAG: minor capsid protein [Gammaproteobacteria bacterium]|nr:minor capsid protein [Gammaproteobacteria bacterium]